MLTGGTQLYSAIPNDFVVYTITTILLFENSVKHLFLMALRSFFPPKFKFGGKDDLKHS